MEWIDLHTHSTASDGSLTPEAVVAAAKAVGLTAVALTDHDTVAGLPEAMTAAERYDIECIPGIELSAVYDGETDLHIVGLFIDWTDSRLKARLAFFQEIREKRNLRMIKKMQEAGVEVTMEKIRQQQGDGVITRANLAKYLMMIGYVSSVKEAFAKYLSPGQPFYEPKTGIQPEQAVGVIRENGGVAVLAHPISYKFSKKQLESCVEELISYGLQGIECLYSTYTPADEREMKRLAMKYGLALSGGSDFHGSVKPHIQIGRGMGNLRIPYEVLESLRELRG